MASFCIAVPGGGTTNNVTIPMFAEIIAPARKPVFIRRIDFLQSFTAIPQFAVTLTSAVGTPVTANGPWDQGLNIDPDDPTQYSQTKVLRAWFTPPTFSTGTLNNAMHKVLFPSFGFWPRGGIALQKNTSLVFYAPGSGITGASVGLNIEFDE